MSFEFPGVINPQEQPVAPETAETTNNSDVLSVGLEREKNEADEEFRQLLNKLVNKINSDEGLFFDYGFEIGKLLKFNRDDDVINVLLANGGGLLVADQLKSFSNRTFTDDELATKLINVGNGEDVINNLEKFSNRTMTDDELIQKIIEAKGARYIVYLLEKFSNRTMTDDQLIQKIIEAGQVGAVTGNFDKFSNLSETTALTLIKAGRSGACAVAENLDKFSTLTKDELFIEFTKLFEAGQEDAAPRNLDTFTNLTEVTALKLIEAGQADAVVNYLDKFSNRTLTDDQLIQKIIEAGQVDVVIQNLDKFSNRTLTDDELALKIIEAGQADAVVNYLDKFPNLAETTVIELIKAGKAYAVTQNLDKFPNLTPNSICTLDISHRKLTKYIQTFPAQEPALSRLLDASKASFLHSNEISLAVLTETSEELLPERLAAKAFEANTSYAAPAQPLIELGLTPRDLYRYADREAISRHDAFLGGGDIAKLIEKSGFTPRAFFHAIMMQVRDDTAEYPAGLSYHQLNMIANRGVPSIAELNAKIEEYSDEPELQVKLREMFDTYQDDATVYASWRTLRLYAEGYHQMVHNIDRIRMVTKLEQDGKLELAAWYGEVAKSGTVSPNALLQFITKPGDFFENKATHTPDEYQHAKKPSNYTHIPNLDLTAEQLRDALVEGNIDELAAFPAFSTTYTVPPPGKILRATLEALETSALASKVLGSRRANIPGLTEDQGKGLFAQLRTLINEDWRRQGNESKMDVPQLLDGRFVPSTEAEQAIREACIQAAAQRITDRGDTYLVNVHSKSDPAGVTAGNDTACCMPFGDGKQIVYMFNPACAQFTIQKEVNGERKTVAQSVLTLNVDTQTPLPTLRIAAEQNDARITNILPEKVLASTARYVVADSVEVDKNFEQKPYAAAHTETIYADFFARYFEYMADPSIDNSQVVVGMQYSGTLSHLTERVPNTFLPVAPVSYSDNNGEQSIVLRPKLGNVQVLEHERQAVAEKSPKLGIAPLTYADTLPVAYLEGKAYNDTSLITGLHNMENGLIAMGIANAHFDRPNLSLKYSDEVGKLKGYIFAYEGKWGAGERGSYEDEGSDEGQGGERCIYISDLASDLEGGMTGGRIINAFLEQYKKEYLDVGDAIPIYCEARESTSYQIITKQLPRFAERLGIELVCEELNSFNTGEDTMHVLRLAPAR